MQIKQYYETYMGGKIKYTVSYYDGDKHQDGSNRYNIAIFKSRDKKDEFIKKLKAEGYVYGNA